MSSKSRHKIEAKIKAVKRVEAVVDRCGAHVNKQFGSCMQLWTRHRSQRTLRSLRWAPRTLERKVFTVCDSSCALQSNRVLGCSTATVYIYIHGHCCLQTGAGELGLVWLPLLKVLGAKIWIEFA